MIELYSNENNKQSKADLPFSSGYRGEEVEEIDLVLIGSETEGCVEVFVDNAGKLDLWTTAVLGLRYHDLAIVVRGLDGEARDYFRRLETLARLVLEAVCDSVDKPPAVD